MAQMTVTISVHFAWWLKPYLAGVRMMCLLTGMQPDIDKVVAVMHKGMKAKATPI
jgi:hypothetical protein